MSRWKICLFSHSAFQISKIIVKKIVRYVTFSKDLFLPFLFHSSSYFRNTFITLSVLVSCPRKWKSKRCNKISSTRRCYILLYPQLAWHCLMQYTYQRISMNEITDAHMGNPHNDSFTLLRITKRPGLNSTPKGCQKYW